MPSSHLNMYYYIILDVKLSRFQMPSENWTNSSRFWMVGQFHYGFVFLNDPQSWIVFFIIFCYLLYSLTTGHLKTGLDFKRLMAIQKLAQNSVLRYVLPFLRFSKGHCHLLLIFYELKYFNTCLFEVLHLSLVVVSITGIALLLLP